jgi:hypothetical protein
MQLEHELLTQACRLACFGKQAVVFQVKESSMADQLYSKLKLHSLALFLVKIRRRARQSQFRMLGCNA